MKIDKLFVATKGFIVHDGKVLVIKESSQYQDGSMPDHYGIAGGRIEPGEKFDESLLREIREETGLAVKIGQPFFVNEWRPVVRGEQWQIVGIYFECMTNSTQVELSSDHEDYKWIDPEDYKKANLIENLWPAFEAYLLNN